MINKYNILLFTLLCFVNFTISARILIIMPSPSLSHHLFHRQIIKELSIRGHDVVSVSPNPMNDPTLTNLTEIDIHNETYGTFSVAQWLEESQNKPESQLTKLRQCTPQILKMSDKILNSSKVKQLITNNNEHFDLFIIEMLTYSAFFPFKERFNCPAIGISSLDTIINSMDAIGNSPDPNYYASFLIKGGPNLSFWERMELLWHHIDYRIYYYTELAPKVNELVKKHFNTKTKDVVELEKSIDLILTNTNPVFHIPKPHVPNYIEIGGLHERERKPLPQELKTYLDNSKAGVVYFSLGSNVQTENLPAHIQNYIVNAFQQLPYNVVWKWGNNISFVKPKNVLIKQWLPQQDVLDHPNLKVFVTQGGLQSLEEAIRSRVPMVGVPFGVDQEFNIHRVVTLGIGRQLQLNEITTELLIESITDVATNLKYKNNIIKTAKLIYDQPTKPLDRAIWWIEYVIRHRGAQHLRCPAADLPWYKYLLLDVIGFVLGVLILCTSLFIYLIKIILKYFFSVQSKRKIE